jgi:phosphatidate phosphatase APP1
MIVRTSYHAQVRQAQRNLSFEDIAFIYAHGRRIYTGGALHIFLGRRDMPAGRSLYRRYERLEGTVLVVGFEHAQPVLVTAYRNRQALKTIRRKLKRRQQHSAAESACW